MNQYTGIHINIFCIIWTFHLKWQHWIVRHRITSSYRQWNSSTTLPMDTGRSVFGESTIIRHGSAQTNCPQMLSNLPICNICCLANDCLFQHERKNNYYTPYCINVNYHVLNWRAPSPSSSSLLCFLSLPCVATDNLFYWMNQKGKKVWTFTQVTSVRKDKLHFQN